MKSCVLRAMRAKKSVGSASASSSALVCSDCVPPCVAAKASTQVRIALLNRVLRGGATSHSVWQCARRLMDFGLLAPRSFMSFTQSARAARIFRHPPDEVG